MTRRTPALTLAAPVAQEARAIDVLVRARASNVWLRLAGCVVSAWITEILRRDGQALYWAAGLIFVAALESWAYGSVRRRLADGQSMRWCLTQAVMFVQSSYISALSVLLWYAPYPLGRVLAVLYLLAGLANCAATLRGAPRLAAFAAPPTMALLVGLPLSEYLIYGQRFYDLMAVIATALFLAFGANVWTALRAADRGQVEAEAALLRAREAAEAALAARRETLGGVHDELRTPLLALAGAIAQMQRSGAAPEMRGQVEAVARSLEVAEAVFADLSHQNEGAGALAPASVDPRELVRAVVGAFRSIAQDKGLELFLDITPEAPSAVMLDAVRVRQALTHLIANAVRYTDHGGVRVRLVAQPGSARDRAKLGFAIADTGVGMSRSQLSIVFGQSGIAADQGESAGISIAQRLAHAMGAKITAKSELGAGTLVTFWIEAPLAARKGRRDAA